MSRRRSAWTDDRNMAYLSDPYYVADMPTNEERLRHLDYYLRENDTAPLVGGGKKGGKGSGRKWTDEEIWIEEHEVTLDHWENNIKNKGIGKVGI